MLTKINTGKYGEPYMLSDMEIIKNLQQGRASRRKARERIYYIKQRLCGAVLVLLGGVIPLIDNEAGMAAIVCILLGFWLLFTKDKVMTFRR